MEKNSGAKYARKFSNRPESLQSSLGFYVTKQTYSGKSTSGYFANANVLVGITKKYRKANNKQSLGINFITLKGK